MDVSRWRPSKALRGPWTSQTLDTEPVLMFQKEDEDSKLSLKSMVGTGKSRNVTEDVVLSKTKLAPSISLFLFL